MKKVFDFLLSLVLAIVVAGWVYRLALVFHSLPHEESLQYIYFIVELWMFTFFLVVSVIVMLWLWAVERGGGMVNLAKEVKRLSLLLDRKEFQLSRGVVEEKDIRSQDILLRPLKAVTTSEWATQVIEGCFVLSGARRISVFLARGGELVLEKSMGLPDARVGQKLSADDLAAKVFSRQKRLFVTEVETHPEVGRENRLGYVSHSFIIVPLMTFQREVLGVVNLTEKENGLAFTEVELEEVCTLLSIASYRLKEILREERD